MSREKAVHRYLVYVFGETYAVWLGDSVNAVRDEFNRGWDYAAAAERELDHLVIQVLSKERYKPRRGCL